MQSAIATAAIERVSLLAVIREMGVEEIEAFLDNPEEQNGKRTLPRELISACAKQWKQLTDEPFPYTVIN